MTKLWVLLVLLFIAPGIWSQSSPAALSEALSEAVIQASCPLYKSFKTELEHYYTRTDFEDLNHSSGWYRVDDFLEWLKKEEKILKTEKVNIWYEHVSVCDMLHQSQQNNSRAKQLGVYIGARYMLARIGSNNHLNNLVFFIHPTRGASSFKAKTVFIPENRILPLPEALNLGIHETTHLLPWLWSSKPTQPLGELATFYTQHHFALPFKVRPGAAFGAGIRHLGTTLARTDRSTRILQEYNSFLAGAVLLEGLKESDLSKYIMPSGDELSIGNAVFNLLLVRRGYFFTTVGSKRRKLGEKDYIKALLPPGVPHKPLAAFYARLLKKLKPLEDSFQPTAVPPSACNAVYQDSTEQDVMGEIMRRKAVSSFIQNHEEELRRALSETLSEAGITPPALPDGYI